MIQLMFEFAGEIEVVVIDKHSIYFGNTSFGTKLASIDGMKLNYQGVIREFPDLEMNEEWREIAIKRFKDKIKTYESERDIATYIIDELKNWGHNPIKIQLQGQRWRKLDGYQ